MAVVATPAPILTRRVEWTFLRFVRGLYWPEGPDALNAPASKPLDPISGLAGAGVDRPLLQALAPVLSRGTWRFLVKQGGYRSKDVITGAKKRTGRLWEEPIWGPEPLALSHATVLWLAVLWDALAALHTRAPEALSRTVTAAIANPLTPGDRLALTAALTAFARDRDSWRQLPEPPRALGAKIPLFGLAHPGLLPAATVPLDWTFDAPAERLALQYLDEWLVSTWVEAIAARGRKDIAEVRAWDDGMVRAIDALFKIAAPGDLPGSGKEHLLIPLARFYPALLRRFGGAADLRKAVDNLSRTINATGEREAFEMAFGTVLRGGVRIDMLVTQILALAWPDRTESQKRLAAEHETQYKPVRDEIRQLSRSLRREVG